MADAEGGEAEAEDTEGRRPIEQAHVSVCYLLMRHAHSTSTHWWGAPALIHSSNNIRYRRHQVMLDRRTRMRHTRGLSPPLVWNTNIL